MDTSSAPMRLFLILPVYDSQFAEAMVSEYGDSDNQYFVAAENPGDAAAAYLRFCTMDTPVAQMARLPDRHEKDAAGNKTVERVEWRRWVDDNLLIWAIPEPPQRPGVLSWRHFASQGVFGYACDKVTLTADSK